MKSIYAIVLAAGKASRMGESKVILPIGNKLVIQHCIDNLINAGINNIILVINDNGKDIVKAAGAPPVAVVINNKKDSDMAESVRTGMRLIKNNKASVLISLADQPLIKSKTIKKIINTSFSMPEKIIIPVYKNKKGHPTLFPITLLKKIKQLNSLRDIILIEKENICYLDIEDKGIILDMDTPDDYNNILRIYGEYHPSS